MNKLVLIDGNKKIEIERETNPYSNIGYRETSRTPCKSCGTTVHIQYGEPELVEPAHMWAVYPNPLARKEDMGGFNGLTLNDRELGMFLQSYLERGYQLQ